MPDAYEHVRKYPLNVVLASLGFETYKYRKAGTEGYGACPIHGSKKNTTCFSFDDDGRFNCFSCSAKGRGSIDLVMAVRQCGFQEAVEFLRGVNGKEAIKAEHQGQSTTRGRQEASGERDTNPVFKGSYEKFKVPSPWLEARGLTQETLDRYEVFEYNNPKRKSVYSGSVMLKIRRYSDGECVGYLSRNIGEVTPEKPKYLFPKGFAKHLELFGAWTLKNAHEGALPLRLVYLVESPFSVMKFHQLGFPAVSPFGWSVSPEQAAILGHLARGCIYLPDSDKANEIGNSLLNLSRLCWVKSPRLPEGVSDPEQLNVDQIRSLT